MVCIASRQAKIDIYLIKAIKDIQKNIMKTHGKEIEFTTASTILAGQYWGLDVMKEALANDGKGKGKKPISVLNI